MTVAAQANSDDCGVHTIGNMWRILKVGVWLFMVAY